MDDFHKGKSIFLIPKYFNRVMVESFHNLKTLHQQPFNMNSSFLSVSTNFVIVSSQDQCLTALEKYSKDQERVVKVFVLFGNVDH